MLLKVQFVTVSWNKFQINKKPDWVKLLKIVQVEIKYHKKQDPIWSNMLVHEAGVNNNSKK